MSGSSASEIDPRFDPRFQRGYVPDATEPGPAAPARVTARKDSSTAPAAAPDRAPTAEGDAERAIRGLLRPREEPAAVGAEPDGVAELPPQEPSSPAAVPEDVADEPTARPASRWLWIALAACTGFILIGGLVYWSQANDVQRFMGSIGTPADEATRLFLTVLSPALVQAGIVGAIVVLAVWAIRARLGGAQR